MNEFLIDSILNEYGLKRNDFVAKKRLLTLSDLADEISLPNSILIIQNIKLFGTSAPANYANSSATVLKVDSYGKSFDYINNCQINQFASGGVEYIQIISDYLQHFSTSIKFTIGNIFTNLYWGGLDCIEIFKK